MILLKLKVAADVYLRTKITDAVENTLFDTKRLIGRRVADPIAQADCKILPFKVISGPGVKPIIEVNSAGFYADPPEVKVAAEVYLRTKITDAVVNTLVRHEAVDRQEGCRSHRPGRLQAFAFQGHLGPRRQAHHRGKLCRLLRWSSDKLH